MKTITTLNEILALAEQGNLYVRWSRGLAMDKRQGHSRDYLAGNQHNGLSCQRINPNNSSDLIAMMLVEYQFLRRKDTKIFGWLFFAEQNGRDSDNAPTIDADTIVPVGKLSDELIVKLSAYNDAYWLHQRSAKQYDGPTAWLNATPKLSEYL